MLYSYLIRLIQNVLEKHNIPGGFATSFVRGRFEFEASLHEFNGIGTIENPDWEYSSVQWDSESITQNNLSATFSSKQFENKISETIEFTAHLPPLTSSFSGKLNLSFPFCTNFGMFLEYKQKSKILLQPMGQKDN